MRKLGMKNLVICGTSGVGKTFLEEELEKRKISFQLPKYFDRDNRPGERKNKNISLSKGEFLKIRNEFFFTLEYNGCNYGWKRKDKKKDRPVSLAITLKDLESFLKENKDFRPVLLWVDKGDLEIIKERMKKRGDPKEKIEQRMSLAREELKNREEYGRIVKENKGEIFKIKNDKTIFDEVIPRIVTLE